MKTKGKTTLAVWHSSGQYIGTDKAMKNCDNDDNQEQKNFSPRSSTKSFRIRLLGHCIFCLRKTTKSKEGEVKKLPIKDSSSIINEHVPSAATELSTSLLSTFSQFWPYFQNIENYDDHNGEEEAENIFQSPEDEILRGKYAMSFSRLPRMCQFCAEKLQCVDSIWRILMEHLQELRATVKESRYGDRAENFQKSLMNSSLDRNVVGGVLEFLKIQNLPHEVNSVQDNEDGQSPNSPMKSSINQQCLQTPISVVDDINNDHCSEDLTSSFTTDNQRTVENILPQTKTLEQPNSVEGHAIALPCRKPIYQRSSSDAYTSNENETSLDQIEAEEGEQADDESGPEYWRLKPSDDDDDADATTFSAEDEHTEYISDYHSLSDVCTYDEVGVWENFTGTSFDLTGRNKYSNNNRTLHEVKV